jgi:hypothetical protein
VGRYYQVIKNISIIMIPTEPNNSSAFIAWPGSSSSATNIPHPRYSCFLLSSHVVKILGMFSARKSLS